MYQNFLLWFVKWDLNFPKEQWFSLCWRGMMHVPVEKATLQEKVRCWLQYNATKCKVIGYKICEGTDCLKAAWSNDVTSLAGIVAPARVVDWRSNDTMSLLYVLPLPSTRTWAVKTQGSKHSLFTPLLRFSIHTADNWLLPLLFLRSVSILCACPVINIRSCHEGMKLSWIGPTTYHHIQGFITPNFVTISYDLWSFNLLNAELNPSCKSQLAEFFWVGI